MSVECPLDTQVRLVASDGTTVVREFHDHAAGLHVMSPLVLPMFGAIRSRSTWRSAQGDVPYGKPRRGTGVLPVNLLLEGSSWPQFRARLAALEADLWAEDDYFVEVEIEGVVDRYVTDVPSYDTPELTPSDIARGELEFQLRFVVQPLPVTTIPV